jgi:hypothetical protein
MIPEIANRNIGRVWMADILGRLFEAWPPKSILTHMK